MFHISNMYCVFQIHRFAMPVMHGCILSFLKLGAEHGILTAKWLLMRLLCGCIGIEHSVKDKLWFVQI